MHVQHACAMRGVGSILLAKQLSAAMAVFMAAVAAAAARGGDAATAAERRGARAASSRQTLLFSTRHAQQLAAWAVSLCACTACVPYLCAVMGMASLSDLAAEVGLRANLLGRGLCVTYALQQWDVYRGIVLWMLHCLHASWQYMCVL